MCRLNRQRGVFSAVRLVGGLFLVPVVLGYLGRPVCTPCDAGITSVARSAPLMLFFSFFSLSVVQMLIFAYQYSSTRVGLSFVLCTQSGTVLAVGWGSIGR